MGFKKKFKIQPKCFLKSHMTLAVIIFLIKYLKVIFWFSATGSIKKILNKLIFITIKIMKSKAEPGCLGLLIPYSNLTT